MSEEEEILKQTFVEEEDLGGSLAEKMRERKALEKKKRRKRIIIGGILLLFAYAVYWLFKPIPTSLPYGICKTFLELNVPYPYTLRVSEYYALRDGSLKLWYTHIDAFGEYRLDSFQCVFGTDPTTGASIMAQARVNKLDLSPDKIKSFNNAIPYLVSNPPNFPFPARLPDSLQDLQIETDKYRKPIFDTRRR